MSASRLAGEAGGKAEGGSTCRQADHYCRSSDTSGGRLFRAAPVLCLKLPFPLCCNTL
jgi:hypothetical protein